MKKLALLIALMAFQWVLMGQGNASGSVVELSEAIDRGLVKASFAGKDIEGLVVTVQRLEKADVEIELHPGSMFLASGGRVQDMVLLEHVKFKLSTDSPFTITVRVACAKLHRAIPGGKDVFSFRPKSDKPELALVAKAVAGQDLDFAVVQAAVWIVTDDPHYNDLGVLKKTLSGLPANPNSDRLIGANETVMALKLLDEVGVDVSRKGIWFNRDWLARNTSKSELKEWFNKRLARHQLNAHTLFANGTIGQVRITPDQQQVVVLSSFGELKLLRFEDFHLLNTWGGRMSGSDATISISKDGKLLALGGRGIIPALWAMPDGSKVRNLAEKPHAVGVVAFSPDGETIAVDSDRGVEIQRTSNGMLVHRIGKRNEDVSHLLYSANGTFLVGATYQGEIKIWNPSNGKELKTLRQKYTPLAIAIHPEETMIAISVIGEIHLWETGQWTQIGKLKLSNGSYFYNSDSLAFSPDGKRLAAGVSDGLVLWGLPEMTILGQARWDTAGSLTPSVNFSADGKVLVVGAGKGVLRKLDVAEIIKAKLLRLH